MQADSCYRLTWIRHLVGSMRTIKEVLANLPVFKNEVTLVTWKQSTDSIIKEIVKTHKKYQGDYDNIYWMFDTGKISSTCEEIWNFCKHNLRYTIESEDEQSVKSPTAILTAGQKIDCKHYSLFIGGVLDAMRYNEGDNFEWYYRFASYSKNKTIQHVFVVVMDGNNEIWIDPVLEFFNERKRPTYFIDVDAMTLVSISGIGSAQKVISVERQKAESDFLILVNMDFCKLKTLMRRNMSVTYGPVKAWFDNNGFDFNQLLLILKK